MVAGRDNVSLGVNGNTMTVGFGGRMGLLFDSINQTNQVTLDGVGILTLLAGDAIEQQSDGSFRVPQFKGDRTFLHGENGTVAVLGSGEPSVLRPDGSDRIAATLGAGAPGSGRELVFDRQGNVVVRAGGREVATAPAGSLITEGLDGRLRIQPKIGGIGATSPLWDRMAVSAVLARPIRHRRRRPRRHVQRRRLLP
jgi:hypothetical protein